MIHPSAVIDASVKMGRDVTIWQFATVCADTVLGDGVVVGSAVWIGRECRIGQGVHMNHGCFIPHNTIIGDHVFIGPGVILTDDRYPAVDKAGYFPLPPVIEAGASIGAGAVILPGVTIGAGAMIGAGAVVSHDVAPGEGRRGEPARLAARTFPR